MQLPAPTVRRRGGPESRPPLTRMSSRTLTVLTTVARLTQARRIARRLVQEHLAACVHVAPLESFYQWRGSLQHEREYQLTIKTTAARAPALKSALKAQHPYELPAIYVVVPRQVHAPYARWVQRGCTPPRARHGASSRAKGRTAYRP